MPALWARAIAVAGATVVVLLTLPVANSDEAPSLKFARLFNELCVESFPNVSSVKNFAASNGLEEVTEKIFIKALAPDNPHASWQGWRFERDRIRYIVGFSEGIFKGVPGQTCNLARLRNGGKEIADHLSTLLNATKQIEFVESGTLITIFTLKKNLKPLLLTLIDYEPSKIELLHATITNDPRVN